MRYWLTSRLAWLATMSSCLPSNSLLLSLTWWLQSIWIKQPTFWFRPTQNKKKGLELWLHLSSNTHECQKWVPPKQPWLFPGMTNPSPRPCLWHLSACRLIMLIARLTAGHPKWSLNRRFMGPVLATHTFCGQIILKHHWESELVR